MSVNTNPVTSQAIPEATQPNTQEPQIPTFLQTANKVTKLITAAILTVVSIGSLAIGFTMVPFAPEIAAAAAACGTALLGAAGYLFYSGLSTAPDLSSRPVTTHS